MLMRVRILCCRWYCCGSFGMCCFCWLISLVLVLVKVGGVLLCVLVMSI